MMKRIRKLDITNKHTFILLILAASFIINVKPVFAHKATVFAWIEGETVHTQSKLSGGRIVKNGEISVYDDKGNHLLSGKTNVKGEFSFKIPQKTALKIVLDAGYGHKTEWYIPIEEINPGSNKTPYDNPLPHGNLKRTQKDIPGVMLQDSYHQAEIELAMEKILDRKLAPIHKKMAEFSEDKPSITDILGGIGYIIGLVGLASYINFRRSNYKTPKK